MDSISLDLKGSEIESVVLEENRLSVVFSRAYLTKTLTGSVEQTRWWQSGRLEMEGAELESAIPFGPLVCESGEIEENIYSYRDMVPMPCDGRGHIRCTLRFVDVPHPLIVSGKSIRLTMDGTPRYIEHLRPTR